MSDGKGVAIELSYLAHELELLIVPQVEEGRRVLWILSRRNYQYQIGLVYHLDDLDSSIDVAPHPELERLQRENNEAFGSAYSQSVLVLVEANISDLLVGCKPVNIGHCGSVLTARGALPLRVLI